MNLEYLRVNLIIRIDNRERLNKPFTRLEFSSKLIISVSVTPFLDASIIDKINFVIFLSNFNSRMSKILSQILGKVVSFISATPSHANHQRI